MAAVLKNPVFRWLNSHSLVSFAINNLRHCNVWRNCGENIALKERLPQTKRKKREKKIAIPLVDYFWHTCIAIAFTQNCKIKVIKSSISAGCWQKFYWFFIVLTTVCFLVSTLVKIKALFFCNPVNTQIDKVKTNNK